MAANDFVAKIKVSLNKASAKSLVVELREYINKDPIKISNFELSPDNLNVKPLVDKIKSELQNALKDFDAIIPNINSGGIGGEKKQNNGKKVSSPPTALEERFNNTKREYNSIRSSAITSHKNGIVLEEEYKDILAQQEEIEKLKKDAANALNNKDIESFAKQVSTLEDAVKTFNDAVSKIKDTDSVSDDADKLIKKIEKLRIEDETTYKDNESIFSEIKNKLSENNRSNLSKKDIENLNNEYAKAVNYKKINKNIVKDYDYDKLYKRQVEELDRTQTSISSSINSADISKKI